MRCGVWLLLGSLFLTWGCETMQHPNITASAIALAVQARARTVAKDMALSRDPMGCGHITSARRFEAWGSYSTSVDFKVWLEDEEDEPNTQTARPPLWRETTLILVQDSDSKAAREQLDYLSQDSHGQRVRELRQVDGQWYASEDGAAFVAASHNEPELEYGLLAKLEAYERLLALSPVKKQQEGTLVAAAEGTRCVYKGGRGAIWFDALDAEVKVESLTAHYDTKVKGVPTRRKITLLLRTLTGERLRVELSERSNPDETPLIQAPELPPSPPEEDFRESRALIRQTVVRRLLPRKLRLQRENP